VKAAAESAAASSMPPKPQAEVSRNESNYAVLRADTDGVVVETLVEPGQVVAAGQVVRAVAHSGSREAVIELPETLRPVIGSTGRATHVRQRPLGTASFSCRMPRIRRRRTFEARYVLDNTLATRRRSTISVHIADPRSVQAVRYPSARLFDAGKGAGVWLIQGDSPRSRAQVQIAKPQ